MKSTIIFALLLILVSCSKKQPEEVEEAIDQAQTLLSKDECQKAIDILEDVGRDTSNAIYLQVLSSAYACKAGYSDINFLTDDIDNINTSATLFLSSLSILSLSEETEADSDDYVSLREAINVLLDVDSSQPSQTRRETKFGERKAGDIGVQILFLSIVQLGKFLHYYGDVGLQGEKGGGSGSNTCFAEYTYPAARTYVDSNGGVCNSIVAGDGHPDLSFADLTVARRRLCEGLMLITNMMDILSNMSLPSNESMEALGDVQSIVSTLRSSVILVDPSLETLTNTTSQEECEALVNDDPNEWNNLQYIYAILFESNLTTGVP